MSNTEYWKTLNEMLRKDKIEFTAAKPATGETIISKLTFKNSETLKKGIQFALDNPKVVAQLEYELNNGQPIQITEKHLDRAKMFIESEVKPEVIGLSTVLNARSDVPIDDFLLECFVLAQRKQPEYHILIDNKRKELVSTIFDSDFIEEPSTASASDSKYSCNDISCTQIIFDSADFASAIDELLINLSDCTWAPRRIQSVYVQESLQNEIYDAVTADRLNASNQVCGIAASEKDQQKIQELAKKYGGKLVCSDNKSICLLFEVPPKYLAQSTNKFHQIPVAINFFRTAKEVIQLVKSDYVQTKIHLTSIWTENIGLFYEVAAGIDSNIIWSNSIGLFDIDMPLLNSNLTSKQNNISSGSTVNASGKYALHTLVSASKAPKYLYIPFGKTFAN